MSFADRAKKGAPTKAPTVQCYMGALLDSLPPKESEALAAILDDDAWSIADLTRAIRDEGHQMSRSTVARHRKRECACPR